MKHRGLQLVLGIVVTWGLSTDIQSVLSAAEATAWKAGAAPLMTRWARDVSPESAHGEYPRPQMVRRRWRTLNGVWQLQIGGTTDAARDEFPERILVPFPVESALSGVMKKAERLRYRRTFEIPETWRGDRVLLHFQAVDWEAIVYVNGQQIGTHRGGYDPFSFDITDALKPSRSQELIVAVFDPSSDGDQPRGKQVNKPGGIYYTPSTGIWQSVWIEPVPGPHIGRLRLVPDVDDSCLRLTVEGIGTSEENTIQAVAHSAEQEITQAFGGVGAEIRLEIPREKLELWSPDNPFLYDLSVTLLQGDTVVDEVESYFGMRKIDLAKDPRGFTRMRLNGEFLFQMGPLDQGFWPDGLYTAPTDEALRFDLEVTKRLGFNMTRKHVKVEPARWYYWCDKLGLLVWQDMPSGDNSSAEAKRQFEIELRRMIRGLENHPSIIMWVVFNEGWGQHDTPRYVEIVEKMDASRLVSNASGWTDKNVGHIIDIHSYPGPAAPNAEEDRASVLGEFGGLGLGVDGHTWTDRTWGYRGTVSSLELTRRYQDLMSGVWGLVESTGLSAAVYTQITDVETECNGLLTYDRAVVKVDAKTVTDANRGLIPRFKAVVPTSRGKGILWRYTFTRPGSNWYLPEFDDSEWQNGPAGFGTKGTPGSRVRTEWNTEDIWIRREFDLPDVDLDNLELSIHHDEDAEVYINGLLAVKVSGYSTGYERLTINEGCRRAMRPGDRNSLAVHCRQTMGGQSIDVGLVVREEPPSQEK